MPETSPLPLNRWRPFQAKDPNIAYLRSIALYLSDVELSNQGPRPDGYPAGECGCAVWSGV
jgi:hypothetical protein